MSGVAGGDVSKATTEEIAANLKGARADDTWTFSRGDGGICAATNPVDTLGSVIWEEGSRAGVVYGAVTNLTELQLSHEELFDRLFRHPAKTARRLEGSFLLTAYDGNERRYLVVTDKLGARPCYFTTSGAFGFATSTAPLLGFIDDPTLDLQGVSDMLLMGHMWGDRTLVEEIRALRPSTVLEVTDTGRTIERYWKPGYSEYPAGEQYLRELTDRYRQAVRRASTTLPDDAGIWLSGGLDSRTTAGALVAESGGPRNSLRAFTYDANPPTRDNPVIGSKISQKLGIEFEEVPLTADTFGEHFERVIEATDGMVRWNTVVNLSATYSIERPPEVMTEGMQGALLGDHLLRPHLHGGMSPVESQYSSEASASVETVSDLLGPNVDPLRSFEIEVEHTNESTDRRKILDIHFQNYYNRSALASNKVMRERVGSRVLQADGDYLEWCAKLPSKYRVGTFPFTGARVPYGTSRAKLELIRRINPDLADVTYERTKLKPSWPYPLHIAGFVGNVVTGRLRSKSTYGTSQLADWWIRDSETKVHRYVRELVDDAASRPLFDGDAVREVFDDHMDGANNAPMLAQITTLEYWIQNHLD
jgi:asparagine synthase (glutamine-hydrolysing)